MKKELRADYIEVAATTVTPPAALPARLSGSHQVERAFFSLKSSTWTLIDQMRHPKNLTASQFIELLVLKASR